MDSKTSTEVIQNTVNFGLTAWGWRATAAASRMEARADGAISST